MIQAEGILFVVTLALYCITMLLHFFYVAVKKPVLSKLAIRIQFGALLMHTAAIILRGIAMGRLPMANQYEFSTAFAWALTLLSLIFILKFSFPVLGAFASPVTLLLAVYAGVQKLNELRVIEANGIDSIRNLMPALRSSWLGIHVSTVIIAYGAFGVSFVLSIIFLLRDRMKENGFWDTHIPKKEKLDTISYRCVSVGMMFLVCRVVVVVGTVKVCRHNADIISAVLSVQKLAVFKTGYLCKSIGFVCLFKFRGEQTAFLHRLRRHSRINAGGAEKLQFLAAVLPC